MISQSSTFTGLAKRDFLFKLLFISGLFAVVFQIRFALVLNNSISDDTSHTWWFDPFYYLFLEAIPLSLVFYSLRVSAAHAAARAPAGNAEVVNESHSNERAPLLDSGI